MKTKKQTSVIYTLYAFDGKGPRYCGHTVNPLGRLKGHRQDDSCTYKVHWIQSVGPENIHMSILEITTPEKAPEREIFYIKKLRAMGFYLTNLTDGGEGVSNPSAETRTKMSLSASHRPPITEETRKKRSDAFTGNTCAKGHRPWNTGKSWSDEQKLHWSKIHTGKRHSQETKDKISILSTGRKLSSEARAKISAARKGKPLSAEHREKLSISHRGKVTSPETKVKLSIVGKVSQPKRRQIEEESSLDRTHSPETRAKMSAARKGRKFSPEHRAAISAGKMGIKSSPEARAKMAASQRKRHQREREQRGVV
jgi:hypothetical protein